MTCLATLFLDFDGVTHPLHCHESKHFSCLPGIESALRKMPEIEVVISSTWRLQYSLTELRSRFSSDIADRVVGVTPVGVEREFCPDRLLGYPRHAECWEWMHVNRPYSDAWLAMDDRPFLFRPFFKGLVVTDGRTGAQGAVLSDLLARIRAMGLSTL
ncbi:MAG: HAD domain-containing protein [Acidovorax sp.]|uniref:HAD domain-containing protein n=1 Tax=Acidovorax sp. TaxID=1872122 RepID=UPI00391A41BE